jgi:acetyl-CoA acetyltransferase
MAVAIHSDPGVYNMTELRRAAIVGIGATDFSKHSGRSELRLAVEAITAAAADSGVRPEDIDGLCCFKSDNSDEDAVARSLGIPALKFFSRTSAGGGGGCGTLAHAAMAIACGQAELVVCYRGMNERSQYRYGQPRKFAGGVPDSRAIDISWSSPFGMASPAAAMAQSARRYMYQYGATSEDFGRVSVIQRGYAATNPNAFFYKKPITLEDHQTSRMIADPIRLLDCCMESDGAVAIVVASLERSQDLQNPPVEVLAAAQGMGPMQVDIATLYRENIAFAEETAVMGSQLWAKSRLAPQDIDLAIIYDHFTPAVLMQLEALGFCGVGEAPDFLRSGGMQIDGPLPVNTNGGQLGEAYIHGFNGIAEAVRQLRGTAVNQVGGATRALVTSGSHVPTSGVILGAL